MSSRGDQGTGAKLAKDSNGLHELEKMLTESPSPERVSMKLAHILNVNRNEVALLRVEKGSLRFVFPAELRAAGVIPLSSSAVAARTATTGTSLLSNSFARVKHVSLFESVKLGAAEDSQGSEQMPIQKIMSVPVTQAGGKVVGVIQVSRKGADHSLAGSDFTGEDLKRLEKAAPVLARMPFMEENSPLGESGS
ncbi:MAG: GAF domain-containing protein [Terriglobales bacterium]